jgi:hypothetical protein
MSKDSKTAGETANTITDERLGAAIRLLATVAPRASAEAAFDYYARTIVRWSQDPALLARLAARKPTRIKVLVSPAGQVDGLFEHLCEMVSGECPTAALDPFDHGEIVDRMEKWRDDLDAGGDKAARARGAIEALAWVLARLAPWPTKHGDVAALEAAPS